MRDGGAGVSELGHRLLIVPADFPGIREQEREAG